MSYEKTREQLVDQREAARFLGLAPRTLESWRSRRIGPRFIAYSRRCIRYRIADLQDWVTERAVETSG